MLADAVEATAASENLHWYVILADHALSTTRPVEPSLMSTLVAVEDEVHDRKDSVLAIDARVTVEMLLVKWQLIPKVAVDVIGVVQLSHALSNMANVSKQVSCTMDHVALLELQAVAGSPEGAAEVAEVVSALATVKG